MTPEEIVRAAGGFAQPFGPKLTPRTEGPPGTAAGAFAKSFATHALDTAALPVTLPARAAEYLGYPNSLAHLSADEALESEEYLRRGVQPSQVRLERAGERQFHPDASSTGAFAGDMVGGAAQGELGGALGGAARSGVRSFAREVAATGGPKAFAKQVALAPAQMMLGLPVYTVDAEGQAIAKKVLGTQITEKTAEKFVGSHPALDDGAAYYVHHNPDTNAVRVELSNPRGARVELEYRHDNGKPVASLELFKLPEAQRGQGVGRSMLKQQVAAADKAGIHRIDLTAAADGRAVWPTMGFELKNPAELRSVRARFDGYLSSRGIEPTSVPTTTLQDIARFRAPGASGSDFLRSGPELKLTADLKGQSGSALRSYLSGASSGSSAIKSATKSSSPTLSSDFSSASTSGP